MISFISESFQKFLLDLFTRLFRENTVLSIWKKTIIILLPKPVKYASTPENYKQISLTSCIYKLMEKMVNFRLTWPLEKENSENGDGYTKFPRTAISHVNSLLWPRKVLQYKPMNVWRWLRGTLCTFITNYLADRKVIVRVGNGFSNLVDQLEGKEVSQVWLFFPIVINDTVQVVLNAASCRLYVDDFTLHFLGGSL